MKSVAGPIDIPAEVSAEGAELAEGASVGFSPPGGGLLEAGLADVAVATFDQAGAAGQVEREGAGVIELVGAVFQIAERGAHRGILVRYFVVLRAGTQRGEDAGAITGAERLSERCDKAFGVGRVRGGGEILVDVKPIDGGSALLPKLQPGRFGDPRRAVAEGVNLIVERPARRAGRLCPAQAGVGRFVQGCGLYRWCASRPPSAGRCRSLRARVAPEEGGAVPWRVFRRGKSPGLIRVQGNALGYGFTNPGGLKARFSLRAVKPGFQPLACWAHCSWGVAPGWYEAAPLALRTCVASMAVPLVLTICTTAAFIAAPLSALLKDRPVRQAHGMLDVAQHFRALSVQRGDFVHDFLRLRCAISSPPLGFFTERAHPSTALRDRTSTFQRLGVTGHLVG